MPKDHEMSSSKPARHARVTPPSSSAAVGQTKTSPSSAAPGQPGSPPPAPLHAVDTDRLAVVAEICREASAELIRQGYKPDGEKELRRFGLLEVCRYMLPLDPPALRAFLKAHPDLPRADGPAPTFSLEEINLIRACHARVTASEHPTATLLEGGVSCPTAALHEGDDSCPTAALHEGDDSCPTAALHEGGVSCSTLTRPDGSEAKVVGLCNFKGGVAKTTTAAHLAMAAALDGLSVLVVDLDSQASISTLFGARPADERGTAYAAMAWDRAQAQYAAAKATGVPDPAGAVDEAVRDYLDLSADDLVLPTHWPTIDILPAQLSLYWAEFQVPVWLQTSRGWRFWDALGNFLEAEGLKRDYDVIIVDTPPALGYLTINALAAADILLVPVGASFIEFDSTGRFFDMLATTFASIEETLGAGHPNPPRFRWDAVQVLLTRYDEGQQAELADLMTAYLGDLIAPQRQTATALIGQAGERVSGLYEAPPGDFNPQTYRRGRATFDESWAMLAGLLGQAWAQDAAGQGIPPSSSAAVGQKNQRSSSPKGGSAGYTHSSSPKGGSADKEQAS